MRGCCVSDMYPSPLVSAYRCHVYPSFRPIFRRYCPTDSCRCMVLVAYCNFLPRVRFRLESRKSYAHRSWCLSCPQSADTFCRWSASIWCYICSGFTTRCTCRLIFADAIYWWQAPSREFVHGGSVLWSAPYRQYPGYVSLFVGLSLTQ